MPKIFIIILNWNGLKDTLECLESVYRLVYPNFEVIVVDNCSSDDSVQAIRQKYPQAILIENSKNLGFTGGNNVAMKYAMEAGADYVCLLNNDTVVEVDTLVKIVDEAERSPEIGLVSPVVHFYDNPDVVQFMGAYPVMADYEIRLVKDVKELGDERLRDNILLFGTALLIKRRLIETVGYLSEKYFAYCEDYDYSLRALRSKFRTSVRSDARIFHKDSGSTGKDSTLKTFLRARNTYFLWMDNVQGGRRLFLPGYYLGMMIAYASFLRNEGNEKCYEACLDGVWAAFAGRGGAYNPSCVMPAWSRSIFDFFVLWHPYFWIDFFKCNFRRMAQQFLVRSFRAETR